MNIRNLNQTDAETLYQCLLGVFEEERWLEEYEFATRLGIARTELGEIMRRWPDVDTDEEGVALAVNNTANEVCNGIPISEREWLKRFKFTRSELEDVYSRFKEASGLGLDSGGYFNNLM